jgi:hypothetical protein
VAMHPITLPLWLAVLLAIAAVAFVVVVMLL